MLTCTWHLWVAVQGGRGTLRLADGATCTTAELSQFNEDQSMSLSYSSVHHDVAMLRLSDKNAYDWMIGTSRNLKLSTSSTVSLFGNCVVH